MQRQKGQTKEEKEKKSVVKRRKGEKGGRKGN